jgi:RNA polymerase sigma-32 factor
MTRTDASSMAIALRSATEPLSREAERELFDRWRTHGDLRAREMLARSQLRWVATRAHVYARGSTVTVDELFAQGCEGLAVAMTKWDAAKGTRLNTYASVWIHRWMTNAVAASITPFTGERSNRASLSFALRKHARAILAADAEGLAELCRINPGFVGVSIERLREMAALFVIGLPVSLDAPMSDDADAATLHSAIADPSVDVEGASASAEEHVRQRRIVDQALAALTEREQFVIRSTILQHDGDTMTLEAVGELIGVCRERVRQIQDIAIRKMRAALNAPECFPRARVKAERKPRPKRKHRTRSGRPPTRITHNNVTLSVREWSTLLDLPVSTIHQRLRDGLPLEQVLSRESLRRRRVA